MNNTPLGCVKYKIIFFFHKWTYYTSIIYTFNSSSGNVPFLAAPDIFFSFVEYSERLFLRHHLKKRRQMHKQQNNSNMADIRKTIVVITTVCPADTFCLEYSEKKNVYWQWNEFIHMWALNKKSHPNQPCIWPHQYNILYSGQMTLKFRS